jgi:ketosteroid isomerase-like protein
MRDAVVEADLKQAFGEWVDSLKRGDMEQFIATLHEQGEFMDEDFPWRMDKTDFVDHIKFHFSGLWDSMEWKPREVQIFAVGDMGHVSGFSTMRGKVRDSGFRQRFMGFTQAWVRERGQWKLLSWHQSPLEARIIGASPD